ncbi:nucleoside-diphosphate kinase [Paenibacillus mucilaginosus]|uniref:nucleoside-diphosphate kinase n=1 Tax=Paenibacillus mucilaginosus TaxID=61624 RepID=UPI003D21583D
MEKTFLMVKPDGVQRGLVAEIMGRFERRGFQLVAAKLLQVSQEQAERHYEEHHGKPFYDNLIKFVTSGPVFAMVWEGDDIITLSRTMIGKTNAAEAQPGTIRGDFAASTRLNLIHGSDSPESAEREIANYFSPDELVVYTKTIQNWIYTG